MNRCFSIKTINLVTLILSVFFFLFSAFSIIYTIKEEINLSFEFQQMMQDIENFNFQHNLSSIYEQIDDEPKKEDLLFNNGLDAFLYAYNYFINANTYHAIAFGEAYNTIAGITLLTQTKSTMIKFSDGSSVFELMVYEEGNTFGRTNSQLLYYNSETGYVYTQQTTNVVKSGTDYIINYSNNWDYTLAEEFKENAGILPGYNMFDFNARSISGVTYYNETKINGVLREYQVQINANTYFSGRNYVKALKYMGASPELPVLKKLEVGVVLDKQGILKALKLSDEFNIKVVGIPIFNEGTVNCQTNSTYHFLTINGQINVEKPNVSNVVIS